MEKHARYSNQGVLWTSQGPITGKSHSVNHSGGWGCLAVVLTAAIIILIEVLGPDQFARLMYEISMYLLGG